MEVYGCISRDDIDGNKLVQCAPKATIPPFNVHLDRYKHWVHTGPTPLPSKRRRKGGPLSTQMRVIWRSRCASAALDCFCWSQSEHSDRVRLVRGSKLIATRKKTSTLENSILNSSWPSQLQDIFHCLYSARVSRVSPRETVDIDKHLRTRTCTVCLFVCLV
jgi:hypothetical protein